MRILSERKQCSERDVRKSVEKVRKDNTIQKTNEKDKRKRFGSCFLIGERFQHV